MKRWFLLLTILTLASAPALADDESHHHEDPTAEQFGTVHFPVSCNAAAQKQFEQGVALLHSFWYERAQATFKQVAAIDPQCAMAHWGIAMSLWHQLWNRPDAATVKTGQSEVLKATQLHAKTDREQEYIAAMGTFYGGPADISYLGRANAYSKAMDNIYTNHPEDLEAAAFYALSLLASEPDNDTTFANRKQAAAVLEKLFTVEPNHPGVAHYLIHSYDKPQLAQFGLPAARRYAQIAPAAPHALHMPSHIFARLGLWDDDIASNLASVAATRKTAAMGGEGHQFHAMDFLSYAYLQNGHEAEAQRLIDEIRAMPAKKDDMYGMDFDPRTSALVTLLARQALELHQWSDAAALTVVPGASIGDNSITYWARAIGAARSGDPVSARKDLNEIANIKKSLIEQKKPQFAEAADQDYQEADAWIDHAEGKNEEATKVLQTIAEKEEAEGDEPLAIPAREMLADMLVDMNRPEQALAEYQTDLKFNPNRFDGLYGAAHTAEIAGKSEQANTYYAQLVKMCAGSNSERAELQHARTLLAQK
jgi:tetratricopeptide (TPR) repeat protein